MLSQNLTQSICQRNKKNAVTISILCLLYLISFLFWVLYAKTIFKGTAFYKPLKVAKPGFIFRRIERANKIDLQIVAFNSNGESLLFLIYSALCFD